MAYADIANVQGSRGENYRVRVVSLKQARFKTTIQQQYDFSCGSAAVATLLTYQYGYKINEETVFQKCTRAAIKRRSAAKDSRCST